MLAWQFLNVNIYLLFFNKFLLRKNLFLQRTYILPQSLATPPPVRHPDIHGSIKAWTVVVVEKVDQFMEGYIVSQFLGTACQSAI